MNFQYYLDTFIISLNSDCNIRVFRRNNGKANKNAGFPRLKDANKYSAYTVALTVCLKRMVSD